MKKTVSTLVVAGVIAMGFGTAYAALSRTAAAKPAVITAVPTTSLRQPASGS